MMKFQEENVRGSPDTVFDDSVVVLQDGVQEFAEFEERSRSRMYLTPPPTHFNEYHVGLKIPSAPRGRIKKKHDRKRDRKDHNLAVLGCHDFQDFGEDDMTCRTPSKRVKRTLHLEEEEEEEEEEIIFPHRSFAPITPDRGTCWSTPSSPSLSPIPTVTINDDNDQLMGGELEEEQEEEEQEQEIAFILRDPRDVFLRSCSPSLSQDEGENWTSDFLRYPLPSSPPHKSTNDREPTP